MNSKYISLAIFLSFYQIIYLNAQAQAEEWELLGLENEIIFTIAVDSQNSSIIYAGSGSNYSAGVYGSIFKSLNGGNTWETLVTGVDVNQIVIHPQNSQVLYAALGINNFCTPGVIKSTDGGESWFWADSGLYTDWETNASCLAFDPLNPDTLYAGTRGFFGGTVYKTTNGGLYWIDVGDEIVGSRIGSLAVDSQNPQIVYAGTSLSGAVNKSINGGINWFLTGLHDIGAVTSVLYH